ncbi:MAG: hypothetical protein ACR2LC_05470 [Pyrinomonadaceae bacterium]
MPDICVAHLVREQNGTEPLQAFLKSYAEHPAGIKHKLLIIFKGFKQEQHSAAYHPLLNNVSYESLHVPDRGFDLGSYFTAAQKFGNEYFCFLNSHSTILGEHWLAKMHEHITRSGVGVVSAAGNCESHYTSVLNAIHPATDRFFMNRFIKNYAKRRVLAKARLEFDPYPNYHIRTNAFMLARETMLKLEAGPFHTKMDCYKFESGKRGLTRQLADMNLRALVVGRDGNAYEKEEWFESATFRSGEQRNLLVADNQTRDYEQADSARREMLTQMSWGTR